MTLEGDIQNKVRLALGSRPDVRIFRAVVGRFRMLTRPEQIIAVGQPGQADLNGILLASPCPHCGGPVPGRRLEVEVKQPGKNLDPAQILWRDMMLRFGAVHITAHSVEEAVAGIEAVTWIS